MSNHENDNVKTLQELYEFGQRCYKKGYRRAGIELSVGIGLAVVSLMSFSLVDKITGRRRPS